MRLLLLFCVFIVSTSSLFSQEYLEMIEKETFSVQEIIENAEKYFSTRDKGKGSGYKQFKRWEYNAQRLMNEDGYLRTIVETRKELQRHESVLNETAENRAVLNDNWQELGPTSINPHTSWSPGLGRITSLYVDKDNNHHIIVGAETGGVWKTLDGGDNWTPMTDYFNNLSVYAVAMDPLDSSVYYFGSSGGALYKSIDAGATWQLHSTIANSVINKILIHPTDVNIMYASLANQGVFRSQDAGLNWVEIGDDNRGYDVEFKPGDTSVIYASGSTVFVSTDNGDNFTALTGFNTDPKMIAVTPDNPNVIYVAEANGGRFGALYKSEDSGLTFSVIADNSINYFGLDIDGLDNYGQAPRDMDIAVSPIDENEVHLAGINTWMSLDGGVTFNPTSTWLIGNTGSANVGYCHADIDILHFEGTTLYAGTDGGFFKAENTPVINSTYYTDLSEGIGVKQLYKIGVSKGEDVRISGGSQDNGTSVYREDTGWRCWIGADGMETFFLNNSDQVFGTSQNGVLYRSLNGANSLQGLNSPASGQGNWVTPFEGDNEGYVYVGYNRVYRSENLGASWQSVSQNFGINLDNLKVAPTNNDIMYASRGANFYRTTDAGVTDWETMTAPGSRINSIAIHPNDANKVVVTTTSTQKVFVSLDGGETWEGYRKNLPNFSALCVVWDNDGRDGIYLGMDYGIFYIDNETDDWVPYNTNLPNVIVAELDINQETRTLYAGTYGRGVWHSPLLDATPLGVSNFSAEMLQVFPNPAKEELSISLPVAKEADVRIFGIKGELLAYYKDLQINGTQTINVSSLKTGVYFVRVATESGTITKKFLKE